MSLIYDSEGKLYILGIVHTRTYFGVLLVNPHQSDVSESLIRGGGGANFPYWQKMGLRDSGDTNFTPHWG